jgi:hypothetical protein
MDSKSQIPGREFPRNGGLAIMSSVAIAFGTDKSLA